MTLSTSSQVRYIDHRIRRLMKLREELIKGDPSYNPVRAKRKTRTTGARKVEKVEEQPLETVSEAPPVPAPEYVSERDLMGSGRLQELAREQAQAQDPNRNRTFAAVPEDVRNMPRTIKGPNGKFIRNPDWKRYDPDFDK